MDDTISSKTKPSSRALHPIEDAYFHQSHLKGKQDYGHQAVAVSLVTVGSRSYYVYRYEGNLNGVANAVVLISYPKDAFLDPRALRAFISTNTSLSTREILERYVERWPVEVFFRQSKDKLAFDRYQVRSSKGIRRYWLLMSLAHFTACTRSDELRSFEEGYVFSRDRITKERISYIYQCGKNHVLLADVLATVA